MTQKDIPMTKELPEARDVTARAEEERASMEVKGQIFRAVQKPRNEQKAMRDIERIAKIPEFAEKAYYSYPRSKTEIFGPSIHLADELKRIWENIITKQTIPYEDEDGFVLDVMAWDLETNIASSRQALIKNLIQRKDASGRTQWVRPDERDKRELIERHHSLLRRNCLLGLFPRWFVDKIVGICRETIKKKAKGRNIEDLRKKVEQDFGAMGIYREQIENYMGHSLSATTVEEITELQGIIQSIKDGAARKEEYFGHNGAKRPPEEKQDITLDQVLNGEVKHEESKGGPQDAQPQEAPPLDQKFMEEFKKSLTMCKTAAEVQMCMKEAKSQSIPKEALGLMATLANDRMRDLLKEENR